MFVRSNGLSYVKDNTAMLRPFWISTLFLSYIERSEVLKPVVLRKLDIFVRIINNLVLRSWVL